MGEPAMQQSLFPDGAETLAMAMSALRDLDVSRGRAFLSRARERNPKLVNLDVLDEAVGLLEGVLGTGSPTPDRLADVMTKVRTERISGRLAGPAGEFVDETIARYWRRKGSSAEFVDDEARLHRGVLDLIRGDPVAARRHLDISLNGTHHLRADLWGYRGDAAWELRRTGEESACYGRGLVLSAADVDLVRCRMPTLVRRHETLCTRYPRECARELLLIHAWLHGLLSIPVQNRWLDERDLGGPVPSDAPPDVRYQRFARLLYLDRSLAPGGVGIARREEMLALAPDLFRRYIDRCRALEADDG